MAISGVVITLRTPEAGLHRLEMDGVTLGQPQGDRVPAVIEARDLESSARIFEHLEEIEGVVRIELVCLEEAHA